MRDALLFKTTRDPRGKPSLQSLVARVAVPIPTPPDVVIYRGRVYVLHYEGVSEVYYREAKVYHYQKSCVMVDGRPIDMDENQEE